MADDRLPLDDAPDPEVDTPESEPEDTAEDGDSSQTDWTPKDRTSATRKITELAQENARLRSEAKATPKPDAGADDDADEPTGVYLEDQNALLAAELYGPEVSQAAEAVWEPLMIAETTADYMAVLESYHEARLAGGTVATASAPDSEQKTTRDEAVRPRVDTNRDGGPDSDDKFAEARKTGKLGDFTSAAAAALGFGPSKPS